MSMTLMVKAMQVKVGNPLRKLVLIKLADNANDKGECWPSYRHIADQCEIGHSTVRKHVQALAEQGLLTIENRKGVLGNSSNLYRLKLDKPMSPDSIDPMLLGSTPAPADNTPPMPADSTRTSHSFESVNEPFPAANATGDEIRNANYKPEDVIDLYNRTCGHVLPKCLVLNRSRTRAIKKTSQLKLASGNKPFIEHGLLSWQDLFEAVLSKPWNTGNNPVGWKANFDYMTREGVVASILEEIAHA